MKKLSVIICLLGILSCKYYTKEYQLSKLEQLEFPLLVKHKRQYSVMEMYVTVNDIKGKSFTLSYVLGEYFYNRKMIGDTITKKEIYQLRKEFKN